MPRNGAVGLGERGGPLGEGSDQHPGGGIVARYKGLDARHRLEVPDQLR